MKNEKWILTYDEQNLKLKARICLRVSRVEKAASVIKGVCEKERDVKPGQFKPKLRIPTSVIFEQLLRLNLNW